MPTVDSEALCRNSRQVTDISHSLRRGLEMLEVDLNAKKLKRLNDRVRNSSGLSIAFWENAYVCFVSSMFLFVAKMHNLLMMIFIYNWKIRLTKMVWS